LRGQQLKIEPPYIANYLHFHHFGWVKAQAFPSDIIDVSFLRVRG